MVLVVEDLHWADAGLLDFLESLLEWSRSSPVIVVSLARPELADRRPTWGSGLRSATTPHLDRLTDGDIETMVTGYVDGLPADDVLDIPETLHALVAARLDNLPEDERALLEDASIAGHSFTVPTVCAIGGHAPAEVEPLLGHLVRKEFLDRDVDPRSAERGQYRFVQSVLQEVAVSTLSKAARRAKHLACAAWLEGLDEDELAGSSRATTSTPIAPNPVQTTPSPWPTRPGSGSCAPQTAPRRSARPSRRSPTPSGRSPWRGPRRSAPVCTTAPRATHPVPVTRPRSSSTWVPRATPTGHSTTRRQKGACWGRWPVRGEFTQDLADRLVDVETRLPEDCGRERVIVLSALAVRDAHARRVEQALGHSERALVLAQSMDLPDDDAALGEAVEARAFVLHMAGRHLESGVLESATVALTRRADNRVELARALLGYGVFLIEDDPRAALEAWLESARLAGSIGLRPMQALALANVSEAVADLGDFDAAEQALDESTSVMREEGTADAVGFALTRTMLLAHHAEPAAALADIAGLEAQVVDGAVEHGHDAHLAAAGACARAPPCRERAGRRHRRG
ncbi:MAG: hypothetical protein WAV00_08920 [Nocardioides sp.]